MQPAHSAEEIRRGTVITAAAGILFATSYPATAFALHAFTPLTVALWRGLGGGIGLFVFMLLRRRSTLLAIRRLERRSLLHLVALGVLAGPCFTLGMNLAIAATGATVAAFVAGLYAVLAAAIGTVVLREPLGRRTLAGLVLALGGTALLADLELGPSGLLGMAAGLGGALAYAFYLVLSRRWGTRGPLSGDLVSLSVMFSAGVVLALPVGLLEPNRILPARPDPAALAGLAWLAIGPSVSANLLIQAGVRLIPARRFSALLLLNPVTATALSAALLGERLSAFQYVGAGLVLVGIATATGVLGSVGAARRERRARKAA